MKLKFAVAMALVFNVVTIAVILLINSYQHQATLPRSNSPAQLPTYTLQQVGEHETARDCWVVVNQNVYNVTNFIPQHPGGAERIIPHCGQDATTAFSTQGGEGLHSSSAEAQLKSLQIGTVASN